MTYSRGPHDVTGLGPSWPLHKWPPVKSAPAKKSKVIGVAGVQERGEVWRVSTVVG